MYAVALPAHYDGKRIVLDEPFPIKPNARLLVTVFPKPETERDSWLRVSAQRLEDAYGDDEPDSDVTSLAR